MVNERTHFIMNAAMKFTSMAILTLTVIFSSCDNDPDPVNEEETITTVNVALTPVGQGTNVTLQFKDLDGAGTGQPVKTIVGPVIANKTYTAVITFLNEAGATPVDITAEVNNESSAHLLCFTTTGNLQVVASDADANGMPIGLTSTWTTGASGNANVKILLRHQPGTKTGICPGTGETDAEVDFDLAIQ